MSSKQNTPLDDASRWIKIAFDETELEQSLARVHRTATRRKKVRRVTRGLALAALVAVGVFFFARNSTTDISNAVAENASQRTMLEDGSTYELISQQTQVIVDEVSAARMRLRIETGQARFRVTHRPERTFQVRCGDVEVSVLGTVFSVERAGERTRVKVDEGRVKVAWPGESALLELGDEGWFPPTPASNAGDEGRTEPGVPQAEPESVAPRVTVGPAHSSERRKTKHKANWRELARRGHFDEAYSALSGQGVVQPESLRKSAQDLFLVADSARLSGHPREALPFLDAILENHRDDPRAPLAAFTRGRVLLQLRQPAEAATAFQKVRELRCNLALCEDALAREAEAWSLAGDSQRARQAATEYLQRFPDGRRADEVRSRLNLP